MNDYIHKLPQRRPQFFFWGGEEQKYVGGSLINKVALVIFTEMYKLQPLQVCKGGKNKRNYRRTVCNGGFCPCTLKVSRETNLSTPPPPGDAPVLTYYPTSEKQTGILFLTARHYFNHNACILNILMM